MRIVEEWSPAGGLSDLGVGLALAATDDAGAGGRPAFGRAFFLLGLFGLLKQHTQLRFNPFLFFCFHVLSFPVVPVNPAKRRSIRSGCQPGPDSHRSRGSGIGVSECPVLSKDKLDSNGKPFQVGLIARRAVTGSPGLVL